ncbi:hypothetical protein BBJ28_00003045 [Nothophytophthora sp. Chile5]|nr:hypothetical protein BBJ28_00003045 [Nothophytophthora sp. Chile5]
MRRPFARFDEELQDSDQTISAPVPRLGPRVRLATVASSSSSEEDARRRRASASRRFHHRYPQSAFFSDTTDDDTSLPLPPPAPGRSGLSMSAYRPRHAPSASRAPLHMSAGPSESKGKRHHDQTSRVPRLHVGAIQFPTTRSVLWYILS